MIELRIHGILFTRKRMIPEQWNELTGQQLIEIAEVLQGWNSSKSGERDSLRRDLQLARILSGLDKGTFLRMNAAEVYEKLLPLTAFVKNECNLTEQLLPVVKVNGMKFYGPDSELRNLQFAEFDFAERDLYLWHKQMETEEVDAKPVDHSYLYRFVAYLYRPAIAGYDFKRNPAGDPREPFNAKLSEYYAAEYFEKHLPLPVALAITFFYKGCRKLIVSLFPDVFDGANKSEISEVPAYFDLMAGIAETGVYGDFSKVEQMYLYNALLEMRRNIKLQQEMKEQLESLTGNNEE